jgi:purine-binding chemotaxis protein CheW
MNESTRQILEARAQALAQPRESADSRGGVKIEVVTVSICNESYAFAAQSVREVLPMKDVSPLPCTPPFICGMINVRGQILTVIDIRPLFGLRADEGSGGERVIILRAGDKEAGLLADAITGLRVIDAEQLQASLPTFDGMRQDLTRGVVKDGLVLLDALKLLSHPAFVVCEEVSGQIPATERTPQTEKTP